MGAGTEIGGYRVVSIAGRGGMGVVYRAQQIDLDRPVALKLIASRLAHDEAFRERFVRESRATAAIDHPNVIPVYSAGEDAGRLFLAMRFVDGEDLRSRIRADGPLTAAAAAKLVSQIGSALDAAHERGLVHRDVKPANVLLDGDHAYLTDFGLTKRVDGESSMTGADRWVGTLGYIAPEQIRSEPVDARTDVYALGCLLYFMLTGESPYRRDTDEATLFAHLNDPPPPLHMVVSGVPKELADVVDRALAKDPADRFQSAGDLGATALAAVGAGAPRPERVVARGAAAPGGELHDETLIAGGAGADATEIQGGLAGTAAAAATTPSNRKRLVAGLAAIVVAAIVVAVLATTGGSDGTASSKAAPPRLIAGKPIYVGPRPTSVNYGFDHLWVAVPKRFRLVRLPVDGKEPAKSVNLRAPVSDTVAAFGAIWVASSISHHVIKLDPQTMRVDKSILLPAGDAVVIDADSRHLWIGLRATTSAQVSSVIRVDPKTGEQKAFAFGEEGISSLATGGDRVWIPNKRRPVLSALDKRTLERKSSTQVGAGPRGVAYGRGFAWVTSDGANTLAKVSKGLRQSRLLPTCLKPIGVAVSAPGVWIACNLSDEVWLFDPDQLGSPKKIRVGANPYGIAASGDRAWVTNLADGTVTPLRYASPDR